MTLSNEFFIGLARYYSGASKDPSTKVGAVIVRPDRTVAGMGFNGFPRGMEDKPELLNNRDEKYPRSIHAELNALLTCTDQHVKGYTCYTSFKSCERCLIHLGQVGIKTFYFPKPTENELTRWGEAFARTDKYAAEMGIELHEVYSPAPLQYNQDVDLTTALWWVDRYREDVAQGKDLSGYERSAIALANEIERVRKLGESQISLLRTLQKKYE